MARKKLKNLDIKELQEKVIKLARKRTSVWAYKLGRGIIRIVGHRYFRLEINGERNLNLKGKFIIAPVHRSNLDAPLLNSCSNHRINSLAKLAMFSSKLSLRISAIIGCIPLNRGGNDRGGINLALGILEKDEALMIFPEGLRSSGDKVKEIFGGCAFLSIKSKAPIVPVGIAGTEEVLPPKKKFPKNRGYINLEVGEAIYPPTTNSKKARQLLTTQIHEELQRLQDIANHKSRSRQIKRSQK